ACSFDVSFYGQYFGRARSQVVVTARQRHEVQAIFEVFETALAGSRIEPPQEPAAKPIKPTIFIGHGHSGEWRLLSEHLRDLHGYRVQAFESGPRAGLATKEVLQDLAEDASFAILVHTAEDAQPSGEVRARENVIHETGLFQGRLGFDRAIILREEGCAPFSNVEGI